MVKVAVWIDAESECNCAYILLPTSDLEAAASTFLMLAAVVEDQVLARLPAADCREVGYLDVGCLRRPVDRHWLRQRLAWAV